MSNAREQYDRTKRWYEKFAKIDSSASHDTPSENKVDEIYAFFMNAYHVKDWAKHDDTVPAPIRNSVEGYVNTSDALKLCADVCNSLKHLDRNTHRSGKDPKFARKQYGLSVGIGQPTMISLRYEITTKSGPIDAFELATQVVAAWDAFFAQHGL